MSGQTQSGSDLGEMSKLIKLSFQDPAPLNIFPLFCFQPSRKLTLDLNQATKSKVGSQKVGNYLASEDNQTAFIFHTNDIDLREILNTSFYKQYISISN